MRYVASHLLLKLAMCRRLPGQTDCTLAILLSVEKLPGLSWCGFTVCCFYDPGCYPYMCKTQIYFHVYIYIIYFYFKYHSKILYTYIYTVYIGKTNQMILNLLLARDCHSEGRGFKTAASSDIPAIGAASVVRSSFGMSRENQNSSHLLKKVFVHPGAIARRIDGARTVQRMLQGMDLWNHSKQELAISHSIASALHVDS